MTSRDSLHGLVAKDGAARLDLGTLTVGESRELLERVLGSERVKADEANFTQIAERCGHLPLALRISAAQLADQPAAEYLGEWTDDDMLSALTIEGDNTACIRASFGLSYRRLGEPERKLFQLLSHVPGPDFTAEVAAALMNSHARRLLDRLTTAHLLQRSGPGRYTFHDLLRRYARENALPDEQPDALRRLHEYYFGAADAASRLLYPYATRLSKPALSHSIADGETALSWLETERANLVAAIAQPDGPCVWQLADTLRVFFYGRPHPVNRTTDWPAAALAAAIALNEPAALISAHYTFAQNHGLRSPAIALPHYTTALTLARDHDLAQVVPTLLNNVGLAHGLLGQLRQAHSCFEQAAALHLARGAMPKHAIALCNLVSCF